LYAASIVFAVLCGLGRSVGRRVGARAWRRPDAAARATVADWRRVECVVVLWPRRRVYDLAYEDGLDVGRGGGGARDDLDGTTLAVLVGYVRLAERVLEKDVRAGGEYEGARRTCDVAGLWAVLALYVVRRSRYELDPA